MKLLVGIVFAVWLRPNPAYATRCRTDRCEETNYIRIFCENVTFEAPDVIQYENCPTTVLEIHFRNSFIPKLPSKMFSEFSKTKTIYLNRNKISSVDQDAFQNLTNLNSLYLAENEIEEILNGTFANLTVLRTLDLSRNRFLTLNKISLHGLHKLEELILSGNKIMEINSDAFKPVPVLRSLDLSKNLLYKIELDSLAHTPHLVELILYGNFIMHIPNIFQNQSGLHYLDLSKNFLNELNFYNLPKFLRLVNISNNHIVPDNVLISNISVIDISNNSLTEINIGPFVKVLYINNNQLEFLNQSNFEYAVDLTHLIARNNKIVKIEKDVFRNVLLLQILDLSNNNIAHIQVGSFQNLSHLSELNLSNNSLTNLEFGTFSGLNNLSILHLNHNQLIEIPETSFYVLRKLKFLFLNDNLLNTLNINELLKEVPSINTITLSNNRWSCKSLFNILDKLTDTKVGFHNGTNTNVENVYGIACTDRDWYVADAPKEDLVDLKSSKLNQYFENDFKNSSFYQFFQTNFTDNLKHQASIESNRFFKYFKHNMGKSAFFKYFKNIEQSEQIKEEDKEDVATDGDDSVSSSEISTENGNDYYYSDPIASAQIANEGEKEWNQQFLSFANKVTICVIANISIIMLLIFVIVIVLFYRNRRLI